jgi:hypothetical protein
VWLIPFVNIVNYYLTYSLVNPLWRLIATFAIDTLQGYIVWILIRYIIFWLDSKISFESTPVKRIIIQLVLTFFSGITTLIILTEFTNWLATSNPVPLSFYTNDIPIISIWFFVANGIYIGLYYYQKWKESEERFIEIRKIKMERFKVSTPKKELLFSYDEIAGFHINGDYSIMVTIEEKKHLIDFSLDKVEKNVPLSTFFRLNRQYIINRMLVTGYEKGENGKLKVVLKETLNFPLTIQVSRNRAPEFKTWFAPN